MCSGACSVSPPAQAITVCWDDGSRAGTNASVIRSSRDRRVTTPASVAGSTTSGARVSRRPVDL